MKSQGDNREQWSGKVGFILAAAGSAIGLGNVWRFPYLTGLHGGGAFVLIYLLSVAAIGLPLFVAEAALGRRTLRNPVGAFSALQPRSSRLIIFFGAGFMLSALFMAILKQWGWALTLAGIGWLVFRFGWRVAGMMGVLTGFVILSFYSVVGGWTLGYMVEALSELLRATPLLSTQADSAARFGELTGGIAWPLAYHWLFMGLCAVVVWAGVQGGIERYSKILTPLLFIILLLLVGRSLTLKGAMAGVSYYLKPDFSQLSPTGVLAGLGQAFFSLSLGMGVLITYGSYVDRNQNLFQCGFWVILLDTLVALLAGLAIFPALFAQGADPGSQGPGLVFVLLPTVFHSMPYGMVWCMFFFLLLLVAAWTSGISLMEVVVAYFIDERRWPRWRATLFLLLVIGCLGSLAAISVSGWQRLEGLHSVLVKFFGGARASFFDMLDNLASNWFLTLGGMAISLFVGWVWGISQAGDEIRSGAAHFCDRPLTELLTKRRKDGALPKEELSGKGLTALTIWGFFIRWVCPIAILLAFLDSTNVLKILRGYLDSVGTFLKTVLSSNLL